jgi:hypothetical protein
LPPRRLTLPLSGPVHEFDPALAPKTPGSRLVDLSSVDTNPLLPSPFTADGSRPTGPAWYSTVKVAYAIELGAHGAGGRACYGPPGPQPSRWYWVGGLP